MFHNVLATYYLNRSRAASPYQLEKLQSRTFYADTNVLYAASVDASNFHELIEYIASRLEAIGAKLLVYPFTVEEYETSIAHVQSEVSRGDPHQAMVQRNPWLYQEFQTNRDKYLNSIAVCRRTHSLVGQERGNYDSIDDYYDDVDQHLESLGFRLRREFELYDDEVALEEWVDLRNMMPPNHWSEDRYWDFIYKQDSRPDAQKLHDVHLVKNVQRESEKLPGDELGPQIFLVTLDFRQLLRLRGQFPFILSAQQFLEFILPYLFLSDIPLVEARQFPNVMLGAELSVLLVKQPPSLVETVRGFLKNSSWQEREAGNYGSKIGEIARILTEERLSGIVSGTRELSDTEAVNAISEKIAELVEEQHDLEERVYFSGFGSESERIRKMNELIVKQERQITKLQRKLRYTRSQARRRR